MSRILYDAFDAISGSGSVAFKVNSLNGSGDEDFRGSAAESFQVCSLGATGDERISGTGSESIDVAALSGTGDEDEPGTGSAAFSVSSLNATGDEDFRATGGDSVSVPGIDGSGDEDLAGRGAESFAAPALGAAADERISGSGSADFVVSGCDGSGTERDEGAGSGSLGGCSLSSAGDERIEGSGAETIHAPTLLGGSVVGSGGVSIGAGSLDGAGNAATRLFGDSRNQPIRKQPVNVWRQHKPAPHWPKIVIAGSGASRAPAPSLTASGEYRPRISGSAEVEWDGVRIAGDGAYAVPYLRGYGRPKLHIGLLSGTGQHTRRIIGGGGIRTAQPPVEPFERLLQIEDAELLMLLNA